jgi:benzoyl-CoA reductase/2-hydroxyglutaryl-CoA dehydratase subunit BcrC/BadD/HgdB
MLQDSPLPRKAYIWQQRQTYGRRLFGVFPAQYPREILWAMNVLPVEIWDPPLEVSSVGAHLQPYICSVVRLGLELILQGQCDDLDGLLFPHTCDSIQNLASIVHDYVGLKKPCYFFYHPRAPYRDSSREYYLEQLMRLVSRLERQLGPLDPSELKLRVKQGQKVATVLGELYALRARGELCASNTEFYKVLRHGEYLHPDDFLPLLKSFMARSRHRASTGPAVILSGVLPNPPEILTLLDKLGVRVADDDLLNCGRRLLVPSSLAEDPFETLVEKYFAMPPCTTKNSPVSERVDYLLQKVERSGARGIVFYLVKFCEPELFDVPQLTEEFKKRGLAALVIDSEVNQGLSSQLVTRAEAFVEMIS